MKGFHTTLLGRTKQWFNSLCGRGPSLPASVPGSGVVDEWSIDSRVGYGDCWLVIVAIVVAVYSLLTFFFLNEMFKKLVSWMPQRTGQTDISKVAGAAGAARAETIHES